MADLMLRISLDDLLDLIAQLPSEQKRLVRQRLDEDWSARFGQALDAIHADMTTHVSDNELEAEIEQAIREVRSRQS